MARPKKHSASDEPEALAARQREHRLMIRVQPKEPVDSRADPWVVADEGLDALDNIRQLLRPGGQALEELDVAGERPPKACVGAWRAPLCRSNVRSHH